MRGAIAGTSISKVRYYVLGKAPGIGLAAPHSAPSARLPRGRPFVRPSLRVALGSTICSANEGWIVR
jgi:hypothetical protein